MAATATILTANPAAVTVGGQSADGTALTTQTTALIGINVTSITGDNQISVTLLGKGPDNNYYTLGVVRCGKGLTVVSAGPGCGFAPHTLPAVVALAWSIPGGSGASAATLGYWIIA